MKGIKEKHAERLQKSNAAGKIPKAALKKAWTESKEKSRNKLRESTSTQGDGDYTTAQDTSSVVTDTSYSVIKQNRDFTVQQGRKFARKQIEKYRERRVAEQNETARAHTANERGVSPKQAECGTLPDAERHPRRGADLPRQWAKEKAITAKTAPRNIRGVTQSQRRTRTAANETARSVTPQAQMQTHAPKIRFAAKKVAGGTGRMAVAVRSAIRNILAELHSLTAVLAAGTSFALSIVIIISLVAFVSGSAYGIFFAADAPNAASVTVREAVDTLTAEYRDTSIHAAADGIVTVANGLDSWGGSYGYYIQIDHGGGLKTLYAHCSSICVTTGQQVQAGEVIGYVGHTGWVTGNHLHLEVRIDGNRADVLRYFTL